MNPFSVTIDDSEDRNQAAVFAWLNMAGLWGIDVANDPRAYTDLGFAKRHGAKPPERVARLAFCFAVPNAAKRSKALASQLKSTGLRKGVPDFFVPIPVAPFAGLFVEMKQLKRANVTSETTRNQALWASVLESAGYKVARNIVGWRTAVDLITAYLGE